VLTTHVLDVSRGRPAAGVAIELWRDDRLVRAVTTNADGRTDAPLLGAGELSAGVYELRFAVGAYFAEDGGDGGVPFLDVVPVRFGVDDPDGRYHVPLLVSPWSYSTYRGS
jgi:5-hydroxyisourate hydrolase/2-oxo-4-hydroxy-4-carboxy-5-ureidoimidazoline decarboxylase